ncbi:MAG: hypothetical protein ACI96N_001649, partial [Arenicella sp.]
VAKDTKILNFALFCDCISFIQIVNFIVTKCYHSGLNST